MSIALRLVTRSDDGYVAITLRDEPTFHRLPYPITAYGHRGKSHDGNYVLLVVVAGNQCSILIKSTSEM